MQVPTDKALYESGKDVEIFLSVHNDVVTPRLKNLGGFRELEDWREDDEEAGLWDLAVSLLPRGSRHLQCVRLTKPVIQAEGYRVVFDLVVFLTRNGGYVTAIRQFLPSTLRILGGTCDFTVADFKLHESVQDLLEWWDEFSETHRIPVSDRSYEFGPSFIMEVVRALGAMLDDAELRRQASLNEVQRAQYQAGEIYPYQKYVPTKT